MKTKGLRVLYWAPRVLGVLFVLFISMFAMDVFEGNYGFWGTLWALLMHLVPSFIMVGVLVLAWRWEWVGAVACAALAVFYLFIMRVDDWIGALGIPGPLFVIAGLWLWTWLKREEIRAIRSPEPRANEY